MSHYEKGGGTIVKYRLCPLQASSSLFLYSSMFLLTYLSLLLFFSLTPFSFIYVLDLALALYLPTVFPPCLFHFFSFLSQFLPQVNSLSASLKKVTFASSTPSPSPPLTPPPLHPLPASYALILLTAYTPRALIFGCSCSNCPNPFMASAQVALIFGSSHSVGINFFAAPASWPLIFVSPWLRRP